jgi:ketosteroid isomerase-like protein
MQTHSSNRSARKQFNLIGVLLPVLLLPISLPATSIPHPHHQPKQIIHQIEALESQMEQAEMTGNTTVMANLLAEDYLGIYSDGTLATKVETIQGFQDGSTHFTKIHTSDRKIRVYGATAVVTSKALVAGTSHGQNIDGHYRYTRVYHRIDGVWKIVSFEASAIQVHGYEDTGSN